MLMDTAAYGDWNPVFVRVDGTYEQGGTVQNRVIDPKDNVLDIEATIKTLEEKRELRQTGGYFDFLTFDHQWLLEPVEGGTRVVQHEFNQGFYMWFWDSS